MNVIEIKKADISKELHNEAEIKAAIVWAMEEIDIYVEEDDIFLKLKQDRESVEWNMAKR